MRSNGDLLKLNSNHANLKTFRSRENWELKLYVSGETPKSIRAISNLQNLCENRLEGKYKLRIIDLLKNPELADTDEIFATPTLVRKVPYPIRKIIGDLSDLDRVCISLGL